VTVQPSQVVLDPEVVSARLVAWRETEELGI
jgi:hypothetical protein